MRFGDIQYDVDHNVNTTWANVGFRTRLREALIGADYQTTDPLIFGEAMDMVGAAIDPGMPFGPGWGSQFADFTFIDLGSGKGRVLLMAAGYPFRRIVGVELLPELLQIAHENLSRLLDPVRIELVLDDARNFQFPNEPLVVFLFNPFPVYVLRSVMSNLERSMAAAPRPVYLVLHNPEHEAEIARIFTSMKRVGGSYQFVVYANRE